MILRGSGLHPEDSLIIIFQAPSRAKKSKQQIKDDARKSEKQYTSLISTLKDAGLKAIGKRGELDGQILVFVTWAQEHLDDLVRRERHTDFLSGLPVTPVTRESVVEPLSAANRIRLVHSYITSCQSEGGLGISPGSPEWDLIDSITPLHDRIFNEAWVRSWKPRQMGSVNLAGIREQFGESVSLYFAFLNSYTQFLLFPTALGLFSYFCLAPYSPIYSSLLCIWSVVFVEWWEVRERIFSLRFGTRGSFKVEKRRVSYRPGQTWWGREIRMLASLPVILLFAGILVGILTLIFVTEAFVTELYQGPAKQLIAFSPTILFSALVPQVLSFYHAFAARLTSWENHYHQSSYNKSLTLKTFALSAIVAYMPLGLSAFVYVPFGERVMCFVQRLLFSGAPRSISGTGWTAKITALLNTTSADVLGAATAGPVSAESGAIWVMDVNSIREKLNPARLRDQMFAYTVTNQIVNTFNEVGLPFVTRFATTLWNGKHLHKSGTHGGETKQRSSDEQEKEEDGEAYMNKVREEVALPEYDVFVDYSEMVIQFGYVVLWSTIWPLAPVMALINNVFESESDAFKLTVHYRRPIPTRTDSIGPWLDALSFLTWLSALTNSALVYLFSPEFFASFVSSSTSPGGVGNDEGTYNAMKKLLAKAVFVAMAASHGYLLLRVTVRHIIEKIWWKGSQEVQDWEKEEREVKEKFLEGAGASLHASHVSLKPPPQAEGLSVEAEQKGKEQTGFWVLDEGIDEIRRLAKDA
ncbi:hypothetical protein NP233_g6723 [Leucocoprinus birnbaumii]|uniref:DUF590-domain-containing protein n=1 Tax=Leucocoprinus birnbaumii TaxID=56174 RepID=A0AAD5VTC1_9AGAR|nr:hypothetical protein NP233_g6723 [Leucocoprinus birnbaumii]